MEAVSHSEFMEEIRNIIDAATSEGQAVMRRWLTHEVIKQHSGISGEDAPWYTRCGYLAVDSAVREVIRDRKNREEQGLSDRQMVLPGKDFLQTSYVITRDGDSVVVPLDQCTSRELRAKAKALRVQARSLHLHADEIDRYVDARGGAKSA